jgi:mercuric ion transport protein
MAAGELTPDEAGIVVPLMDAKRLWLLDSSAQTSGCCFGLPPLQAALSSRTAWIFSCTRSHYGAQDSPHVKKGRAMTINDAAQETTPAASSPSAAPTLPKWFAALGFVAGLGAVVASSCCVIPLGFAALGASASVLGGLEAVAAWRVTLLSVSALAIVGGWGAWWLKRPVACASGESCASLERSRPTLALLLCGSAIVLAAASWSCIDPMLLKLFRGQ